MGSGCGRAAIPHDLDAITKGLVPNFSSGGYFGVTTTPPHCEAIWACPTRQPLCNHLTEELR